MKKSALFLLAATLLLSACGSSRKSVQPATPYTPNYYPAVSASPVVEHIPRRQSREQLVARRIDSLIVAQGTLLKETQLGLHIVDLTSGSVLYARGEQQRMRPASSEKVVTAIAALDQLGPSYTLDTRLVATAPVQGNTLRGDLYIIGVMDPLLTTADVNALAQQLKSAGIHRVTGRLVADASFKENKEYGWGWCWDDQNPVLSPLLCGGRPGLAAAMQQALRRIGVKVGAITSGTAPANARELVALRRPLQEVLQPMMKESDNLCAEAVFYQMGRDRNRVVARIEKMMASATMPMQQGTGTTSCTIADGSGLSLYNYQTPESFTRLLAYAAARVDNIYQPLLQALPIASVDGTLRNRMRGTAAEVAVRAKTGTVNAVSTLVGYTTMRSTNHLIAFAIMNQGVRNSSQARAFQDEVCRVISE